MCNPQNILNLVLMTLLLLFLVVSGGVGSGEGVGLVEVLTLVVVWSVKGLRFEFVDSVI